MIVTLIPFFLAANITANVGDWKNGPEVVYDARIDYLNYPQHNLHRTFVDNITMALKCRPKSETCLSCRIYDPITSSIVLVDGKENKSQVTMEPFVMKKDRMSGVFELDFNSHGLREIVIDLPSVDSFVISVVKDLAEQLNIGADLPSIPLSVFSIQENSTTGQCETDYVISSDRLKNDVDKDKKSSYEIIIVPTMRTVHSREVKGIKKSISAHKCPYRYQYFDRDWNDVGQSLNGETKLPKFFHESEVKSYKTRMTIMESNYTSYTEGEMLVIDLEKKSTTRRVKKTTVTLHDIVPAEGPLPKISSPMTVNRFLRKQLHQ